MNFQHDSHGFQFYVDLGRVLGLAIPIMAMCVYFDARNLDLQKGLQKGFFNMNPMGWFFSTLLLWPVGFPAYLVKRSTLARLARDASPKPEYTKVGGPLLVLLFGLGPLGARAQELADRKTEASSDAADCDGGNLAACVNAASASQYGDGVAIDLPRSTQLLQRACDGKVAEACFRLGLHLANGVGIAADALASIDAYERACAGNHLMACTNLGNAYVLGSGVPIDASRARDLYERACAGDNMQGCANLGLLLQRGGPADVDRGTALRKRACTGGITDACQHP